MPGIEANKPLTEMNLMKNNQRLPLHKKDDQFLKKIDFSNRFLYFRKEEKKM